MKTMDCNVHRYLAINIAGIRTTLSQVPRDDLRKKKAKSTLFLICLVEIALPVHSSYLLGICPYDWIDSSF